MTTLEALGIQTVGAEVNTELVRAISKHNSIHSAHEGYAVILEELEEVWDEIKKQQPNKYLLRKELIQVAAMSIRFIIDVCDKLENEKE